MLNVVGDGCGFLFLFFLVLCLYVRFYRISRWFLFCLGVFNRDGDRKCVGVELDVWFAWWLLFRLLLRLAVAQECHLGYIWLLGFLLFFWLEFVHVLDVLNLHG